MRPTEVLQRQYRKLRLTTKDINKGFYKGTGTGSMGRHTKRGGYVIEYNKVRTYVVPPGLKDFKVSPRASSSRRGPEPREEERKREMLTRSDLRHKQQLTPFVTRNVQPLYGDYAQQGDALGPRSPSAYLARWKAENGFD